ncbi:MAG: (d)CMP kinase [Ruminococcus sp.]|nr:(d)CMP kinase [Ruminococcus sp.]
MPINIAIDGPAGAGKSSAAKAAAAKLGYIYVDTGALYRAVACYVIEKGRDIHDSVQVTELLPEITVQLRFEEGVQRVFLNRRDVSDRIRTPQVSMGASAVAAMPRVRELLFELQRKTARENNVIMDGRDIGTVVLPNADLKIFLTASPEARADRRYKELSAKGNAPDYNEVLQDIIKRDKFDSERAAAPLKQAPDALLLDTTDMTFEEATDKIIEMIESVKEK